MDMKNSNYLKDYRSKWPDSVATRTGLQYRVLESGPKSGKKPTASSTAEVHYVGTLVDGTEFDSSHKRERPAMLKPNTVIPGWAEAIMLMRPGDKWEVVIPPSLAYGTKGFSPNIPGDATLIFEMQLLSVKPPGWWGYIEDKFLPTDAVMRMNVLVSLVGVAILIMMYIVPVLMNDGKRGPRVKIADASRPDNPRVYMEIEIGKKTCRPHRVRALQEHLPEDRGELPRPLHGREGYGHARQAAVLPGLHLPPRDPRVHVPGR
jgi:hypothetical protein